VARHLGAGQVFGADVVPERLARARQNDVQVIDSTKKDDVVAAVRDATDGRGPDAVIDAVGMEAHGTGVDYAYDRVKQALHLHTDRAQALRQAAMACRKGGTLSVLGVYGVVDKFPMGVIMNKGLTMRTAQQHGQRYVPRLLEHARRGELDPSFLVSHRMSLDDAPQGYEIFKHKRDGCVRAVFVP
jgi:threonine dehydrogenase-like Zn-dependent dehydrogenase